jgi:membrane protease YdiL (CAAX protease family)
MEGGVRRGEGELLNLYECKVLAALTISLYAKEHNHEHLSFHETSSVRLRGLARAPRSRSQSPSRCNIGTVSIFPSGDHRHRGPQQSAVVEAHWLHLLQAGCSFPAALCACVPASLLVVGGGPLIGYGVLHLPSLAMVALYAGYTLLVGFVEEVYFRGSVLQALKSCGVWQATVVTAFLFGAAHASNALYGASPLYTVLQVGYAIALGLAFAALVLVTRLIWPLILAHALTNFGSILNSAGGLQSTPVTPADYALAAFILLFFTTYDVLLLVREQRKEALSTQPG